MPQITLFGATGPTGKAVIREALRRGYTIVVFARSPDKLDTELRFSGKIKMVQGTLDSYSAILSCLRNSTAAFILLTPSDGFPRWAGGSSSSLTVTSGYHNIIRAMLELGVKRLIGIGTPSYAEPQDGFNLGLAVTVPLLKLVAPRVFEDVVETGRLLKGLGGDTNIDWTWLRVSLLYDEPAPRNEKYKLGFTGQGGRIVLPSLSRKELSKALLDEMEERKWVRGMPFCWT
ncbi:hypothetical protein GGU11DRAFT_746537 [Lentinula aff. detonsa]|uniref:NAD(P)-binding domain-containing protein n=1 Tax=Lentinula aff. detonsa TaxID=2804958 RepID=A0AA38NS37_9AGAR|nr:hypothetical protein GGU10DRAFT_398324 [Lentinula aff. detonsa]KAJ3796029.1 hypothetical protein GGU11DRAFT_746537 [Lentinula aff. detonsa]